jgi:hypothetical protein
MGTPTLSFPPTTGDIVMDVSVGFDHYEEQHR